MNLTICRGPNRKCNSSGEEGLAMLPRSRAWMEAGHLILVHR